VQSQGSTYIIAEAGVNHNGSLDMARQLIDVAAEAGADAVKFQTFKAEKLVRKGYFCNTFLCWLIIAKSY